MKKKLFILLLLLLYSVLEATVMQLGAGLDFGGSHERKINNHLYNWDVHTGVSPFWEVLAESEPLLIGLGVEYQIPRKIWGSGSDARFSFLPVYATVRYDMQGELIVPELIAQAGYNFFFANHSYTSINGPDTDLDGGLYLGLGAGVLLSDEFVLQLLYKYNTGKATYKFPFPATTVDVRNDQFNLSIGVRF
jgi:hypothetical protein